MSSAREGEPQQAGGPAPTTDPVGEEKAHAAGGRELVKAMLKRVIPEAARRWIWARGQRVGRRSGA